jgi:beta-lactamase class A
MERNFNTLLDYFEEEAANFSGYFGLAAQRTDTALVEPILFRADDIFPTASVMKLAVLVEYLAQVAAGELAPDRQVVVRAGDQVGGSGVLKDMQPGLRLTLHDLATLAITVSDNSAANLLIERVGGLARINARLRALGLRNTTMGRPFIFDTPSDNTGSPADFLRLLLLLARHQLISPAVSHQMLDLMRRQQFMEYIPRYLPYHPFAAEYGLAQTVTIANKVGMLRGTVNDAAIITTPTVSYALVIFTRHCQDTTPDPDNEGALLVGRLSRRVYDYFLGGSQIGTDASS